MVYFFISSLNLLLALSLASDAIHTWGYGQKVCLATAIFSWVLVLKCCHQKKIHIINNWWAHYLLVLLKLTFSLSNKMGLVHHTLSLQASV